MVIPYDYRLNGEYLKMKKSKCKKKCEINGCGIEPIKFLTPDFIFREACKRHDLLLCQKRKSRRVIDDIFLQDMLKAVKEHKKMFVTYTLIAYIYYAGVRLYAKIFRLK